MIDLPEDLRDFLSQSGSLEYDTAESSIGVIRLKSLDDLAESVISTHPCCQSIIDDPYKSFDGTYQISVCNLIADSDDYDPNGLFCWIPKLATYATIDTDHGDIIVFPYVTWHEIVKNPLEYLDVQWNLTDVGTRVLPWLFFPMLLKDGRLIDPYPKHCKIHDLAITTQTKKHHPLFEIFRDADVDRWLEASRKYFPHAGLPACTSELLSCIECFDLELRWVNEIEETTPPLDAKKNLGGFVNCPRCGLWFSPKDSAVFSERIHLTCGQKINVLEVGTK
ncbi:MAG: hypothetical protein R3B84_21705 [Zavarzinella sp.]